MTSIGYEEAVWTVHFIESRYGVAGIHRLLDAYRRGLSSYDAVESVFGMSIPEFDAALRQWWFHEAPGAWPVEVVRYDLDPSISPYLQEVERPTISTP